MHCAGSRGFSHAGNHRRLHEGAARDGQALHRGHPEEGTSLCAPDVRAAEQTAIIRQHGKRNMAPQAEGKLAIVGPLTGGGESVGLYIFTVPEAEVRAIMDSDVAFLASIFTYETMTLHGFPGDTLPPA